MNREGQAVAKKIVKNIVNHIYQYIGFLELCLTKKRISLTDCLNMDLLASYLAFQKAKGSHCNSYTTLSQQIATAKKTHLYQSTLAGSEQRKRTEKENRGSKAMVSKATVRNFAKTRNGGWGAGGKESMVASREACQDAGAPKTKGKLANPNCLQSL